MSSSPSTQLIIPMEDIVESPENMPKTTTSRKQSQPRFFGDRNKYRPSARMGQELGRPLSVLETNPTTWAPKQITHRQRAEIQLEAILNEPDAAMPSSSHGSVRSPNKMSIEDASKLLNTQPFIVERLIKALFKVEKKELHSGETEKLTRVLNATTDVRALLFFLILDESTDQYVTRGGLTDFYEQYLKNIKTFDKNRVAKLIPVLLQKFHLDQKTRIDFEEFYSLIRRDTHLLEVLSQFTINPGSLVKKPSSPASKSKRFLPKFLQRKEKTSSGRKKKLSIGDIKDNLPRIIIVLLYVLVNLALALYVIIYRAVQQKAYFLVVFARIGGMLLNFNSSFIIVLMLKRTILLIRSNQFLRKIIPVDDHIDFHRIVGRVIAGLALMHGIAHIANFAVLNQYSWGVYMFTTRAGIGWVGGFAPLSGVILSVILAVMVVCSMEWIRRGGHFQVFYWTHLLYFAYFAFLIVHSRIFWEWVIGPLTILLLEKIYSVLARYSTSRGRTYLHSATIEQSNVISLSIHRPRNFTFKPGDYITINIPHVALYEFHPFTLSSAPEDTKYLTIHMQAVGNWTKLVYKRFQEMDPAIAEANNIKVYRADLNPQESAVDVQENIAKANSIVDSDSDVESDDDGHTGFRSRFKRKLKRREVIFVNGPYSSCARYVFDCKHVVLVGGGIGVTPYASILSSLMAQFRASRVVCKNCEHVNYQQKGLAETRRLRKVDFIWVNRDQKNFEWFLNLLRQFEQEQDDYLASNANEQRFLDIHLYFTEIKGDASIGNFPLALVSKVWEDVVGQDIWTSLKAKTHLGRPKWDDIFDRFVTGEHASTANDVNVFFCGPSAMGNTIRDQCANYRFRYYEEKF